MTEIERIRSLPRRQWSAADKQQITLEVSRQLRLPGSSAVLRESQALALYELATEAGLFGALRVGAGKTLITLLAPIVLGASRALLILPASLIAKTERDRDFYAKDWNVSKSLRFMSYEMLGRTQSSKFLENFKPDLIISDECHRLKNSKAAVTRRVARYMGANPSTWFIALSGTIVRNSVKDYAHLATWALKGGSPLPIDSEQLDKWAEVLDDDDNFLRTKNIGPLKSFGSDVTSIRNSFRDRLLHTPGVIISEGAGGCSASLLVRAVPYDVDELTEKHFTKLREDWETPDDWPLADPMQVWRHARELALGLHYVWDPRPPEPWREARRAWAKFCRQMIIRSSLYDSEKQVADAVRFGYLKSKEFEDWIKIRDTFIPNVVPIWHSSFGLDLCKAWAEQVGGGIIWSHHSFFGRACAQKLGVTYYGRKGLDEKGRLIDDTKPDRDGTIIASIPANGTGRNLQAWSTSLVTAPPSGGHTWEQLLGRLHREGQQEDSVTFDVLCGCKEHINSMLDAKRDAQMILATTAQEQKLLYCDYDYLDEPPNEKSQWK